MKQIFLLLIVTFVFTNSVWAQKNGNKVIDKKGEYDKVNIGKSRGVNDPMPSTKLPVGVHELNKEEYYMPYYTAHIGEKSIKFFKKLLDKHPENSEIRGRYVFSLAQVGRFEKAEIEATKAIQLDKTNQWALYTMALVEHEKRDFEKSMNYYLALLKTDMRKFKDFCVDRSFVMSEVAYLYSALHDNKNAEIWFKKSINERSDNFLVLKLFERFYIRNGMPEKAFELYKRILKKDPENINALMNLGILSTYYGDYDEAIKYLKKGIEINDGLMKLYFFLYRAYLKKGDLKKATEMLKKCDTFNLVEQVNIDKKSTIISPYPCINAIYIQMKLAEGDWKEVRRMTEKDIREEDLSLISIMDDIANDYEGYPEFKQEDSLYFLLKTKGRDKKESKWFKDFKKELYPQDKELKKLADKISELLVNENYIKANLLANEALKKSPENLLFLGQAGVSASAIGDNKQVLKLLKKALQIRMNEDYVDGKKVWSFNLVSGENEDFKLRTEDEAKYMARVFTILAITDSCIIRSIKGKDGKITFEKTELSKFLNDKEVEEFGKTISKIRENMKLIIEESDSMTSISLASLIMSDISMTLSLDMRAGKEFLHYIKEDEEHNVIFNLYKIYGKYYGY